MPSYYTQYVKSINYGHIFILYSPSLTYKALYCAQCHHDHEKTIQFNNLALFSHLVVHNEEMLENIWAMLESSLVQLENMLEMWDYM